MFLHERAEKSAKWLSSWHFDPIVIMTLAITLLALLVGANDPDLFAHFFAALVVLSPLWLPAFLALIFWVVWMHYIRFLFWFGLDMSLLEVQLPPDVSKSPLSMELFLISLFNTGGETTFINRFWKGGFRPIFSLEIASNEGRVGYYIHCRSIWRNAVEARIYGQFPDAKVHEVDDYVSKIDFNLEEYELWGGEYRKPKAGALPIKTYVDFGLDKDTDTPETKVDPMSNILELLNNMGPGEHLWFQIIMKGHTNEEEWYGIRLKEDHFKEGARKRIEEIMVGASKRASALVEDPAEKKRVAARGSQLLTEVEKGEIEAIERSMGKQIFDCGFRVLYIAKRDKFFGYTGAHTYGFFRPFISNYNSLNGTRGMVAFDYPWEDFMEIRKTAVKKQFFFFYKWRAYFYVPHDQEAVFMNTEELATIWRFPGSDIKTPGLDRVPSRRSEAPPNLPT